MIYDYMRPTMSGMQFTDPLSAYFGDYGSGGGGMYGGNGYYRPPSMTTPPAAPAQSQLAQMYQGAQLQPQNLTKMLGIWRR